MQIDMVVCVVADRMTGFGDLLQPLDIRLLKNPSDTEKMDDPAEILCNPRRLDRVVLRGLIQVPLLIVPFGHATPRVMPAHLQIERNGDPGLPFRFAGISPRTARGPRAPASHPGERGDASCRRPQKTTA